MESYLSLGVMSGTSLDGLDLALVRFEKNSDQWNWEILKAETLDYEPNWKKRLQQAHELSGLELTLLDREYGFYIGDQCKDFLEGKPCDFMSSHGHTVFHQPDKHLTLQIGHGAYIAAKAGIPVVSDFRSLDLALGGQGAPLVPIGDRLLFPEYEYCLNVGGIANLSHQGKLAYDICPANQVINHLTLQLGLPYDDEGKIARSAEVDQNLLEKLNQLAFYQAPPPRSLGREWVEEEVFPLLRESDHTIEQQISTFTEHMAIQIASHLKFPGECLATGGGSFNKYLIERINDHLKMCKIVLPEKLIVEFKEALIFSLLGVLRWIQTPNSLKSVTGAKFDNCGGNIYFCKTSN